MTAGIAHDNAVTDLPESSGALRANLAFAFVLALAPGPIAAQAASADLAIHELIANPCFDREANGWTLEDARPVPDLGPDGSPAVLLEAASDGWSSVRVGVPGLLGGQRLLLSAQVQAQSSGCVVWLTAYAIGPKPPVGSWEPVERASARHTPEAGEWATLELEIDVPVDGRFLSVGIATRSKAPTLVDDVHLRPVDPPLPRAGMERTTRAELRAIADRVLPAIADLRQLAYDDVPEVRLATREVMARHIESSYLGSRAAYAARGRAFALLGAWPEELDLHQASSETLGALAAGTWIASDNLILLSADTPADYLEFLIAHEAVHALDNQHHGFGPDDDPRPRTHDAWRAVRGVSEGSAALHQLAFMSQAGLSADARAFGQVGSLRVLHRDVPDLLKREQRSSYHLGVNFLTRGRAGADEIEIDPLDVARALAAPPLSTEQLIHPETYWSESARDLPRTFALEDASTQLGEGWALVEQDTLGELMLTLLVGAALPDESTVDDPASWTHPAVAGWGFDVWQLYERGDGQTAATVLATVWDSAADAHEFRQALRVPEGAVVRARDDGLVLVVSDDQRQDLAPLADAVLAQLFERADDEPEGAGR